MSVRADIIFVAFSDRPEELSAAREAAEKRGDKLHVIAGGSNTIELSRKLKQLSITQGEKLAVVVSGENGNGRFWGSKGLLHANQIETAFRSAGLSKKVSSLFLAGCYTTIKGDLETTWAEYFPNAISVGGYDDEGPLGNSPPGLSLLDDFLSREKEMAAVKTQNEAIEVIKSLNGFKTTNAACMVKKVYVSNKNGDGSNLCSLAKSKHQKFFPLYQCYANGEAKCAQPPKSHRGPLREYYSSLRNSTSCDFQFRMQGIRRPSGDTIATVLFDDRVRGNIEAVWRAQLHELDQVTRRMGAPANMEIANLSKLSRKDTIDRLRNLKVFLDQKCAAETKKLGTCRLNESRDYQFARKMVSGVRSFISKSCAPLSWASAGVEDEQNNCRIYLRDAGRQAYKSAASARLARQAEAVLRKPNNLSKLRSVGDGKNIAAILKNDMSFRTAFEKENEQLSLMGNDLSLEQVEVAQAARNQLISRAKVDPRSVKIIHKVGIIETIKSYFGY